MPAKLRKIERNPTGTSFWIFLRFCSLGIRSGQDTAGATFQIADRVEDPRRKGKVFCVALYERKFLVPVAAPAQFDCFAAEINACHRAEMHVFLDEGGSSPTSAADFQNVLPAQIHSTGHPMVELYRIAVRLVHCFQLEASSA